MNCGYHPERDAVGVCMDCGKGICEFCKTIIHNKLFCPNCAEKVITMNEHTKSENRPVIREELSREQMIQRTNTMAKASLAMGIIFFLAGPLFSLLDRIPGFSFIYSFSALIPFVCLILAVTFGLNSMKQAKQLGIKSNWMAKSGLVIGIIGGILLVFALIMLAYMCRNGC